MPDAAGPAHHGLCTAWSNVKDTPGKAAQSTAFRNVQEVGCEDVTAEEPPATDEEGTDDDATEPAPTTRTTKAPHSSSGSQETRGKSGSKGKSSTKGKSGSHGRR